MSIRICSVSDCDTKHYSLGYCSLHYHRFKSTGDPLKKKKVGSPTKHGMSGAREYYAWQEMKYRCYRETHARYLDYGGRGITVYDEWIHDFATFLNDVGKAPSPEHSLDRIDNNGNYEPGNVKWRTIVYQNNNKRNNVRIRIEGQVMTLAEWARFLKISPYRVKRIGVIV